jgi:hypothetical protein
MRTWHVNIRKYPRSSLAILNADEVKEKMNDMGAPILKGRIIAATMRNGIEG